MGVERTRMKYLPVCQFRFTCGSLRQGCHCLQLAGTHSRGNIQEGVFHVCDAEGEKFIEHRKGRVYI